MHHLKRRANILQADYEGTYGISTSGDALTLKFVTGSNIGSRTYLMADENTYEMFKLKNQEFTFGSLKALDLSRLTPLTMLTDVDVSGLPCGLNGALYFSEMDLHGGIERYPSNKAGAKYGTGYCDSQCPQDLKWINGEANVIDWTPSSGDPNSGTGKYGSCCGELDVWEANKQGQYEINSPSESVAHLKNGADFDQTLR